MSAQHLFKKKQDAEGNISHYQAVASVLAGNFGTGNISGTAVALTTGGPGALVWMWLMAFFGSVIQYTSCFLAVKYRTKNADGEFVGGPMYYLSEGLGLKKLAVFFSIFVIFAAFAVGNFAQINSMVLPLTDFGITPWVTGCVIAVLVAGVILGGAKRIAQVSSAVVPLMALFYLCTAMLILFLYKENIFPAFKLIFESAFKGTSATGGVLGYTLMKALTVGFDRAIFATDAGTGTVPILQAEARTSHPVVDGVVALVAPLLVMIVCTTTGLVLMVTGAYQIQGGNHALSTNLVIQAFQTGIGPYLGSFVVIISLLLFGYTTTLAWGSCLQRAVGYLLGRRGVRLFQYLYILAIPVGALLQVDLVWLLADFTLTAMVVINLIGVSALSGGVIQESRLFFASKWSYTTSRK